MNTPLIIDHSGLYRNDTFFEKVQYGLTTASVLLTTPWQVEGFAGCLRYHNTFSKIMLIVSILVISGLLLFIPTGLAITHRIIEHCFDSGSRFKFRHNQRIMRDGYRFHHGLTTPYPNATRADGTRFIAYGV